MKHAPLDHAPASTYLGKSALAESTFCLSFITRFVDSTRKLSDLPLSNVNTKRDESWHTEKHLKFFKLDFAGNDTQVSWESMRQTFRRRKCSKNGGKLRDLWGIFTDKTVEHFEHTFPKRETTQIWRIRRFMAYCS